ncbi:MAG: endolytic transglycosylase MltG [Bacteroidia bacterium]|nr:endolytic transglycosylase MltG [Bacteroidia bacterium]
MKKWLRNPWLWAGVLVVAALAIYPLYRQIFAPNVTTPDGESAEFFVHTGWDYTRVGDQLLQQKLIKDPMAFHWVARQMNYPRNVKPGRYILQHNMSTRDLVQLLRSGKQTPVKFTFVKFRTTQQLADYVAEKLEMRPAELLEALNDRAFLEKFNGLTPQTALAIFIPNTYEVYWNIKPKDLVSRMYKEYQAFWTQDRNNLREKLGLSRLEVVTIASIVEEESNQNEEKPRIAGVYLNRIKKGWPLEADPTVKYAVGDFSLRRILDVHLQTDSPYNTYMYPGIPPGPICTPSIPSIDAVLNRERHDYMFFCAKVEGDGYHHFSQTLAEHSAYAQQYHSMLNQRGIMQ